MRIDREHRWPARLAAAIRVGFPPQRADARRSSAGVPLVTAAEARSLQMISYGLTYSMAAELLGLSTHTIRDQVRSARHRLGAKNATHAVALAIRAGVIT